jgi:hypothetical protein
MAQILRTGVLIRPGEYTYSNGVVEVKTAAELKVAAERQPSFMITMGHPADDLNISDYLGRVNQTWDEENQLVKGEFLFYEEHFDKIPENIRKKIVNGDPLSISSGFSVEEVVNGVQTGILYDHLALLKEGEDAICPTSKCGINIRTESNTMSDKRYEQTSELTDGTNSTSPAEESTSEASSELENLKAEVAEMKELIEKLQTPPPPTPAEPELEPVVEPVKNEEQAGQEVDAPEPEPEMVVPQGAAPEGLAFDERGNLKIRHQPKKSK